MLNTTVNRTRILLKSLQQEQRSIKTVNRGSPVGWKNRTEMDEAKVEGERKRAGGGGCKRQSKGKRIVKGKGLQAFTAPISE